ncbi:MAG: methyltransferase domain-containing protein, partial [Proteobacteria bacterium]|nr:methyltransferase domain-containing protein [Pseudomonadota bacterium]
MQTQDISVRPSDDPILEALHAIDMAIAEKRYASAQSQLDSLVQRSDARVLLLRGLLARALGDSEGALAALRLSATAAPEWPRAQVELAWTLLALDHTAEAVQAADRGVAAAQSSKPVREAAVAIAAAAGDTVAQERHLRAAQALWPDTPAIENALGVFLMAQQKMTEAEVHWRCRLGRHQADDPLVLGNLGVCLVVQGHVVEGIGFLEQALARDPGNAEIQFQLDAARGESPASQPREMVQALFDGYAGKFDRHLVGGLKYRVPRRIVEILRQRHADLRLDILDLGCGTGLMGVYLGHVSGSLVGVDLSARMLQQAQRHNIYTSLHQQDLLDALRETVPGSFECIIAADVFVYVGDISTAIAGCYRVLRPGGCMIFSCEEAGDTEGAFVLRPSKRYAHSRASIEAL